MKGIAIQTILLLLVGILVVGILVYLVYRYTRSSTLSKTECMGLVTNWCTTCMTSGWDVNVKITQDVKDCGNMLTSGWWDDNGDCDSPTGVNEKYDCCHTLGIGC